MPVIECPNCELGLEIGSGFTGRIACKHCGKELRVSGSGSDKKLELYKTSFLGKLKRIFR